jgi:hypothetical protein
MVGLAGLELATSPLSGVRSNHLSYRPILADRRTTPSSLDPSCTAMNLKVGGAERDRTDDLLNANQALSQLSYSPVY